MPAAAAGATAAVAVEVAGAGGREEEEEEADGGIPIFLPLNPSTRFRHSKPMRRVKRPPQLTAGKGGRPALYYRMERKLGKFRNLLTLLM